MKKRQTVLRLVVAGSAVLLGLTVVACQRLDENTAQKVLTNYNGRVIRAFKEGDAGHLKGVTAPGQVERMKQLIEARLQRDLALESRLEDLEVVSVRKGKGAVTVRTRERWCYCDRQASTGQFVGRPSEDTYEKVYYLKHRRGKWVVEKVDFTAPPRFGEKAGPWEAGPGSGGTEGPGQGS